MSDLPEVGASITVVYKDCVMQTIVVDGIGRRDQFHVVTNIADEDGEGAPTLLSLHDEGIGWVRGHENLDSEPVRAAQAAQVLAAQGQEKKKKQKQRSSIKPPFTPQPPAPPFVGISGDDEDGEKLRRELWTRTKLSRNRRW